jgi:hypothetical protein
MSVSDRRAPLHRLNALATQFLERAYTDVSDGEAHRDPLRVFLLDHAASPAEFASRATTSRRSGTQVCAGRSIPSPESGCTVGAA